MIMYLVGLTGGIGSGKSEAARLFAKLGVPVVDTDVIAHRLTAPGQPAVQRIAQLLGAEALAADGSLDRVALRRKVFSEPQARKTLEGLLHPLIRLGVEQELAQYTSAPYAIVVVPLLFETGGYADVIARSLVVDCDEALQVGRAMARSRLSEAEVRGVMAAQLPRAQRLALADDVLDNSGSLPQLAQQVQHQHEKYKRLFK
jgi:dephospho-CoA kinase